MPSLSGFLLFIRGQMGITTAQLPDNSPSIAESYANAVEIVNPDIATVSDLQYTNAVYNFGGDYLINVASDQAGQTFFATARKEFNINGIVPGLIAASNDESTGQSFVTPEFAKTMGFADLQNMKTPYGRTYMAIAQRYGGLWGAS